jgi:hypothetical protein
MFLIIQAGLFTLTENIEKPQPKDNMLFITRVNRDQTITVCRKYQAQTGNLYLSRKLAVLAF